MDNLAFLISCEEYVRDDFKSLSGIKEDVPKMKAALIEHGGILEKNCYCLCQSEDAKGGPTEPEIWKLFEMPNSSIEFHIFCTRFMKMQFLKNQYILTKFKRASL